jgi:hypothetical protein
MESELEGLNSKVAMNKSESKIHIVELASELEKTRLEISKVKNTVEDNQEEIHLKLKENMDVINQRTTTEKLHAERQYEGMQTEIGEMKLKEQSSIPSTHSVQLHKKESNKSKLQEDEESEKDSEEENEMKEKTQRTKGGKLTMGMYTSYLDLPLPLFYEDTNSPIFHLN